MNVEHPSGLSLKNLGTINVILGKNGCGKSFLLKALDHHLSQGSEYGKVRYLSPERGGVLNYQSHVEQNMLGNPEWLANERRRNQSANFKPQSTVLFRQLELRVLRRIEEEHGKPYYVRQTFEDTIGKLNNLLDRVRIERGNATIFNLVERESGKITTADEISSGEAELVSLGIEILAFVSEAAAGRRNILLIDEPDVHLHPDLQHRLADFIVSAIKGNDAVTIILATHSTALLAALSEHGSTRVVFMRKGNKELVFKPVSSVDRAILPMFGAHPLSNVFNEAPVLLVEGEDDERVWQQAVRSSSGKVRVYPSVVDGVTNFAEYETEVNSLIEAVYDDAKAYSLRDRDGKPTPLDNLGSIVRMRLACRAAENMLLSDDALAKAGLTWRDVQGRITDWVSRNGGHPYHSEVNAFVESGLDRKGHDLKDIRNILAGLITTKPWEVLVGQAIADLARNGGLTQAGSLRDFLGDKVCTHILRLN